MIKISDEKLLEIIDDLQGSCKSLYEICESHGVEEDDLTLDQHDYIESEIFLCPNCGWWFELSEAADSNDTDICAYCYEEEQDE